VEQIDPKFFNLCAPCNQCCSDWLLWNLFLDNAIPRSRRQLRVGTQRTVGMARLAGGILLPATADTARDHCGFRAVIQRAALEGPVWAEKHFASMSLYQKATLPAEPQVRFDPIPDPAQS